MIDITEKPSKVFTDLKAANKETHKRKLRSWKRALRRLAGDPQDDLSDTANDDAVLRDDGTPQEVLINVLNLAYKNYGGLLARLVPRLKNVQAVAASREAKDLRAAFSVQRMLRNELLGHRGRYSDEVLRFISFIFCCAHSACLVEGVVEQGKDAGEVEILALSPFDFMWYPHVRTWQRSPVVVMTQRLTKQEILGRWGTTEETINTIKAALKKAEGAKYDEDSGMDARQPGASETVFEINRLFFAKGQEYPDGAQKILLNDKHLLDIKVGGKDTIGTPDGEYPFVVAADVPLGYYDYGYSRMEAMAPSCRAYNENRSRYIQAVQELPVFTISAQARGGMTQEKFEKRPVAWIDIRGGPGNRLNIDGPPDASPMMGLIGMLKAESEDVMAQGPLSRGQPQGSRMPVGTTQALMERAEGQDYVFIDRMRDAIAAIGERIIIEGRKVWSETKVFKVLGAHRKYEAIEFRKADLSDNFSVYIRPDDTLPKSMNERWQRITQGVKDQMITAEHGRKLLEILDEEDEYTVGQMHKQRAYEDFLELKDLAGPGLADQPLPPVHVFDDHTIHIEEEARHAVEEMSATGQPLPPVFEEALMGHRQLHVLMQQQVMADREMMTVPPGQRMWSPPLPEPAPEPGGELDQMPEGEGAFAGPPEGALPQELG